MACCASVRMASDPSGKTLCGYLLFTDLIAMLEVLEENRGFGFSLEDCNSRSLNSMGYVYQVLRS